MTAASVRMLSSPLSPWCYIWNDLTFQNKSLWNRCVRSQLGAAYISATTGAVVTALGLKSLAKVLPVACTSAAILCWLLCLIHSCSLQHLPPIASRFVPFAAVAAANCINIPFMRQRWGPRPPVYLLSQELRSLCVLSTISVSQGVEVRYPGNRWEWKQVRRVPQCCQTGHRSGGGVKDRHGGTSNG